MKKIGTILITGASSGLGAEYFKYIANSGDWRMHDVWMIARDGQKMQALAERYPQIRATVIPLDLADSASYEQLQRMLQTRRPDIYALINNAGFGLLGNLIERDYPGQADIVNNVCAVCPGPMKTDFLDVADIPGNSKAFATLPYCDPAAVAGRALEYARAGRGVYTPRLFYKFYRLLAKVLPHGLLMPLTKT